MYAHRLISLVILCYVKLAISAKYYNSTLVNLTPRYIACEL